MFIDGLRKFGTKWAEIAKRVGTRDDQQTRERYKTWQKIVKRDPNHPLSKLFNDSRVHS